MIVIDTSALVEFLVGGDDNASALRTAIDAESLAAPHGVDLECMAALRGLVKGGKLPEGEAVRALELLARMDIRRYDHMPLVSRIWELRHNMWPYDASFVALTELLDTTLVTMDKKFGSVPGIRCPIYVITG